MDRAITKDRMITINVNEPEGNVFCILGYAKSFQKEIRLAGGEDESLNQVLQGYNKMKYDQILDALEKTGYFKFTGRGRKK